LKIEESFISPFRQKSIDHKRRKLHEEVILVQPISFFVVTAVFFFVTIVIVVFLMRGEFLRKESVVGYISPSNEGSVIRADQDGRLAQVLVNEVDEGNTGQGLLKSWAGVRS